MMDTEAFREFKTGLSLLRDNYSNRALEHIQRAAELERNNPYYMSYLGVALARTEKKWAPDGSVTSPVMPTPSTSSEAASTASKPPKRLLAFSTCRRGGLTSQALA